MVSGCFIALSWNEESTKIDLMKINLGVARASDWVYLLTGQWSFAQIHLAQLDPWLEPIQTPWRDPKNWLSTHDLHPTWQSLRGSAQNNGRFLYHTQEGSKLGWLSKALKCAVSVIFWQFHLNEFGKKVLSIFALCLFRLQNCIKTPGNSYNFHSNQ